MSPVSSSSTLKNLDLPLRHPASSKTLVRLKRMLQKSWTSSQRRLKQPTRWSKVHRGQVLISSQAVLCLACHLEIRLQIYGYCFTCPDTSKELPIELLPDVPDDLRQTCRLICEDSADEYKKAVKQAICATSFTADSGDASREWLDRVCEVTRPNIECYHRLIVTDSIWFTRPITQAYKLTAGTIHNRLPPIHMTGVLASAEEIAEWEGWVPDHHNQETLKPDGSYWTSLECELKIKLEVLCHIKD